MTNLCAGKKEISCLNNVVNGTGHGREGPQTGISSPPDTNGLPSISKETSAPDHRVEARRDREIHHSHL